MVCYAISLTLQNFHETHIKWVLKTNDSTFELASVDVFLL